MQLRQKFAEIDELGVRIVAVAPDKPEVLAPLLKTLKLSYPLLGDPLNTVFKQYSLIVNNNILGGDFVLDEGGVVRYAHRGVTPDDRPSLTELMAAVRNVAKRESDHGK